MNGKYFPNPTFPAAGNFESPAPVKGADYSGGNETFSMGEDRNIFYGENVLNLNKGKKVVVYASFSDANEWKDKKFEGILEDATKDFMIISNPTNGEWHLIPMIYLNFITFEEKVNHN